MSEIINEIWRPVPGYEGLYEVSNFGNVKSLPKLCGNHLSKEKILKPEKLRNGYLMVCLSNNKNIKGMMIHRLVAMAFLENENGMREVDHLDGNKQNNKLNNLKWVTRLQNIGNPNTRWKTRGKLNGRARKVRCIETGQIFDTATEASYFVGCYKLAVKNAIYRKGRCGGYHWEYIDNAS